MDDSKARFIRTRDDATSSGIRRLNSYGVRMLRVKRLLRWTLLMGCYLSEEAPTIRRVVVCAPSRTIGKPRFTAQITAHHGPLGLYPSKSHEYPPIWRLMTASGMAWYAWSGIGMAWYPVWRIRYGVISPPDRPV